MQATLLDLWWMRKALDEGRYADLIEDLSKLPCDLQSEIVESQEGGFMFGFAMLREGAYISKPKWSFASVSNQYLKARAEKRGEDICYRKLKIVFECNVDRASQEARRHLESLLAEDSNATFNDEVFFIEVGVRSGFSQFIHWTEYIKDPWLREMVEHSCKGSEKTTQFFLDTYEQLDSPRKLWLVSLHLNQVEKSEEALSAANRALEICPTFSDAQFARYLAYHKMNRLEEMFTPAMEEASYRHRRFSYSYGYDLKKHRTVQERVGYVAKATSVAARILRKADGVVDCYKAKK